MDLPSLGTTLILVGVFCLIAGAAGAAIKAFGAEAGAVVGPGRILIFLLGLGLIVSGAVVNSRNHFRVVSAIAQWDYRDTENGACGPEPYTLELSTAGAKGGPITYRLLINGRPEQLQTIQADEAKTYPITGQVSVAEAAKDGTGTAEIRVRVLSPQRLESEAAYLDLACYTSGSKPSPGPTATSSNSADELKDEVTTFLSDYSSAVAEYGRDAPEVTDSYYHFPLKWYRAGRFRDADEYRQYVEEGRQKNGTASSKPTQRRCTYKPAEVVSALATQTGTIKVVTQIEWARTDQSAEGEILVLYDLVRDSDDGRLRISQASQNTYTTPCD